MNNLQSKLLPLIIQAIHYKFFLFKHIVCLSTTSDVSVLSQADITDT